MMKKFVFLAPTDREKVRTLYATGKYTQKELAAQFNVGHGTIGNIVHEVDNAKAARTRHYRRQAPTNDSVKYSAVTKAYFESSTPIKDIAALYHVAPATINRWADLYVETHPGKCIKRDQISRLAHAQARAVQGAKATAAPDIVATTVERVETKFHRMHNIVYRREGGILIKLKRWFSCK